jgi:hypothetical protein
MHKHGLRMLVQCYCVWYLFWIHVCCRFCFGWQKVFCGRISLPRECSVVTFHLPNSLTVVISDDTAATDRSEHTRFPRENTTSIITWANYIFSSISKHCLKLCFNIIEGLFYTCACMCVYVHMFVNACVYVCMHVCACVYICRHYVFIYSYICVYLCMYSAFTKEWCGFRS